MNFPNRDAILALVEDELEKGVNLIHLWQKVADEAKEVRLSMIFLPMKVHLKDENTPYIFVPTGTGKKPAGVSNTECKYALVFDQDNTLVFSIDILKDFIRKHKSELSWTMDEYYEVMGFDVNLRKLIGFEKEQRTVK
jgi:hypothetical protein